MITIGAVASENTNLVTGTISPAAQNAPNTGDATMSFDDFLDMINPLQHIPVVSSIYRAVTGDTINPVSRIVGDVAYGGIMGLASAGMSALGAISDEVFAANNNGQTASRMIFASLFGSDQNQETQLAAADTTTAAPQTQTQVALLQTPAKQSPILEMPDLSASAPQMAAATEQPLTTQTASVTPTLTTSIVPGLPLDRTKQAYGGVMDTTMLQNAQQNQALALALAGGRDAMQAQHDIRNNRFAVAPASSDATSAMATPSISPAAQAALAASQASAPTANATNNSIPPSQSIVQNSPKMQNLLKNIQTMKGLNLYRATAQSVPMPGSTFDLAN